MGLEIARALLDLAELHGRIDGRGRRAWDQWVAEVVDVIAEFRGEPAMRDAFRRRLEETAARPRPRAG